MEWKWWRQLKDSVADGWASLRGERPQEPSRAQLTQAFLQVDRATAQFRNAYDGVATSFAVTYHGSTHLVTNAHATTNYYSGSRGYNYQGHSYFIVGKGPHIALAEQQAFNPQGGPCSPTEDGAHSNAPISDLSLLRILSPAESRRLLNEFSFDTDLRTRLHTDLNRWNRPVARDGVITAEELVSLTQGFHLEPISLDDETPRRAERVRTPLTYLLGYHHNHPQWVNGTLEPRSDASSITMHYRASNQVIRGHSGSLMFDVSEHGTVVPLGVNANISPGSCAARAVDIATVRQGITAAGNLELTLRELHQMCRQGLNGASAWFAPHGQPEPAVRPAPTPAGTARQCTAR